MHLNSSFNGATVDHINGQAIVPFSSVASLFPVAGVTLSADPADGPDAVKADAGIAGSVTGTVKQTSPSKITITLDSASGIAAVFSQLSSNSVTITIPQLPAGLVGQVRQRDQPGHRRNCLRQSTRLSPSNYPSDKLGSR